jgi:hypothetical protein
VDGSIHPRPGQAGGGELPGGGATFLPRQEADRRPDARCRRRAAEVGGAGYGCGTSHPRPPGPDTRSGFSLVRVSSTGSACCRGGGALTSVKRSPGGRRRRRGTLAALLACAADAVAEWSRGEARAEGGRLVSWLVDKVGREIEKKRSGRWDPQIGVDLGRLLQQNIV